LRAQTVSHLGSGDAPEALDLTPTARNPDEHGGHDEYGTDERGYEEAAVDGGHARSIGRSRGDGEDADDGGDHADGRDDQRQHQAEFPESRAAEDQGRDEDHGVGLEEVGCHSRAVAYVVADVVGDGRGVTGIVLGDVLLDLADEIGADVGGLREDAAADAHEHGQQGRTEAEALEHLGSLTGVDEDDQGRTEQTESDREHARDTTGSERDAHRTLLPGVLRGSGHADVAAHCEPHAHVAGDAGEDRPDEEEDAPADAFGVRLGG